MLNTYLYLYVSISIDDRYTDRDRYQFVLKLFYVDSKNGGIARRGTIYMVEISAKRKIGGK